MSRTKHALMIISVAVLVVAAVGLTLGDRIIKLFFRPTETTLEQGLSNDTEETRESIEVVAERLDTPWEVAVISDSETLVTERPGRLQLIGDNEQTFNISGVEHTGEGGLLGLALHPEFAENGWVYLYFTTREGGQLSNKIVRYQFDGNRISSRADILTGIPAASIHNGGRIAFGPDGYLYVGTGDANNTGLSQDTGSLAGKILRLTDSGRPAPDNPFDNEVYSYGHRNVQGLAWDDEGRLWATEHGPTAHDELNLITRGSNYGWPVIIGDETRSGMQAPIRHSGPNETWAPSGMAHVDGSLFFGGLRGQSLYQAEISGNSVSLKSHFRGEYGRLRTVVAHGDSIYILTSNTDGRGNPRSGDDKLIRLSTALFE
jgi:glucose/arabinose dehydrogenase